MNFPLLALFLAGAIDPSLLAPGPQELAAQVKRLREHLAEADAVGGAEARIHNLLAAGPAQAGSSALCSTPENRSLLTRSRVFGKAYRDAVQTTRADAARLRRMLEEPTLQPILRPEQREQADELLGQVDAHVRRYREQAAWQARYLEPAARSCAAELSAAPGISTGADAGPVAVVGVGGGRICPAGAAADGRVVVLQAPKACWSSGSCTCTPASVLPGAVIGP